MWWLLLPFLPYRKQHALYLRLTRRRKGRPMDRELHRPTTLEPPPAEGDWVTVCAPADEDADPGPQECCDTTWETT